MRRLTPWLVPLAWMGILFSVSSSPSSLWSWLPRAAFTDKIEHAALYAVLSLTFVYALRRTTGLRARPQAAPAAWLLTAAYGTTEEAHQLFVETRSAEVWDCVAGLIGAGLALGVMVSRARRRGDTSTAFDRMAARPLSVVVMVLIAALGGAAFAYRIAVTDELWNGDFERPAVWDRLRPAWWTPRANSPTAVCTYLARQPGGRTVRCANERPGDECRWQSRDLKLAPGARYEVSVRYRCRSEKLGRPEVTIADQDFYLDPSTQWTTFRAQFTASRQRYQPLCLWLYRRPGQWVEWDDVNLRRMVGD